MRNKTLLTFLCFANLYFGVSKPSDQCEVTVIPMFGDQTNYLPGNNTPQDLFKALYLMEFNCILDNPQLMLGRVKLTKDYFPLPHKCVIHSIVDSKYPHSLYVHIGISPSPDMECVLLGDFEGVAIKVFDKIPSICEIVYAR